MYRTIKLRRDTQENWLLSESVLAPGEPGYETDTGRFKIGNGVARWVDLEYFHPGDGDDTELINLYNNLLSRVNNLTLTVDTDDGPSFLLLYQNAKV